MVQNKSGITCLVPETLQQSNCLIENEVAELLKKNTSQQAFQDFK